MTPAELKAARVALGYTQAAFADLLGIDPSALRRWEMEPHLKSSREPNKFVVEIVKSMLIASQLPTAESLLEIANRNDAKD